MCAANNWLILLPLVAARRWAVCACARRYVTEGAFIESATVAGLSDQEAMNYDLRLQARLALYAPGGLVARELAKNPTVLIVNDTAFAHGGLLPLHVQYGLERMNAEVAAWMRADSNEGGGTAAPPFIAMGDSNSVMWNRQLSREHFASPLEKWRACNALQQALERVGASRLVVGHTPQLSGANCECEGQVWRIDVGMSYGVLNAGVQVLEISRQQDGSTQVVTLRDTPDAADADEYSDEEESSAAMYV